MKQLQLLQQRLTEAEMPQKLRHVARPTVGYLCRHTCLLQLLLRCLPRRLTHRAALLLQLLQGLQRSLLPAAAVAAACSLLPAQQLLLCWCWRAGAAAACCT
jgi:hypothetical protein